MSIFVLAHQRIILTGILPIRGQTMEGIQQNMANSIVRFEESHTQLVHRIWAQFMMTSSNRNIFRYTGHLCWEFTGVHANAIQKSDPLLWQQYRELRNKVTCVIKERKNAYFSDMNVLCRDDPKRMWSEIKRLVPNKNKHSRITCDISANDFNQHFANIGNKMNS